MSEVFDEAFRNAHRISPSQVETAKLCLRKWGFNKLDGLATPSNKYAQTGHDSHEVLELWQRDGKVVDLTTDIGKIVSAGLKFLPQPGTHRTEEQFVFDTGRVVFHGRMDLRGQPTSRVQSVWDHKTTSSFTWMKTPIVLRRDAQAVIYSKAALAEAHAHGLRWGSTLERVELNWVYYQTTPERPRSRKVQLHVLQDEHARHPECPDNVLPEHFGVMTLSELDERFAEVEELGVQLLGLYRDKPKASELPYNATACGAFGGCPFQGGPCKLTYSERIESMESQSKAKSLTLAEKIRNNLTAAASAAAAIAGAAPPAAPKAPAAPTVSARATAAAPGPAPFRLAKAVAALPGVNPPEQSLGVDPDAPDAFKDRTQFVEEAPRNIAAAHAKEIAEDQASSRTQFAARAMESLVAARVYSVDDTRYALKLAADAVKLADALLAALARG